MLSALSIPFTQPVDPPVLWRVQKLIYNQVVLRHVVLSMSLLRREDLELPLSFLGRLVLSSSYFVRQFVDFGGLAAIQAADALAASAPVPLLLDTLQLVSQLARLSAEHYPLIDRAAVCSRLRPLLAHADGRVRAKCANLLGNLCRHSDHFYRQLLQHDLLTALIGVLFCCARLCSLCVCCRVLQ